MTVSIMMEIILEVTKNAWIDKLYFSIAAYMINSTSWDEYCI